MPTLACPKCRRLNPAEAVFCHFDGTPLKLGIAQVKTHGQFAHDFVFPSGRACHTFDDLALGCQQEWEEARGLLEQGAFTRFFGSIGRMDLVQAAQKAMAFQDKDAGLHNFLDSLPVTHKVDGPRLELKPRRLALGSLRAGERRQIRLTVSNSGCGLLNGTLTVASGGEWLHLGEGNKDGHYKLKVAHEDQVSLFVETAGLAAKQSYNGKLTVITNGGVAEVPVSFDLGVIPFHKAPFTGVSSPREMAEKMRTMPKAAVPLLESGDVARWFNANGWVYPASATMTRGVAVVQQFFEGMGLSKPPPLEMSENEVRFVCFPPEVAQGQVTLRTSARKWVYASVDSDAVWLRILTQDVSGPQQAVISFEVDSSLLDPGYVHQAEIQLMANAGQRLSVRVFVEVRRPNEPFTRRLLRPFFTGAILFLIYRLLLAVPLDLYARVWAGTPWPGGPAGSFVTWLVPPLMEPGLVRRFVLATWWLGMIFGAVLLAKYGRRRSDILYGIVAGAGAGLAGSATLACLMPLLDGLPRLVWRMLASQVVGTGPADWVWLWTPLWVVLAAASWALAGGLAGLVLRLGGTDGLRLLARLGLPLTATARCFRLRRVAAFFALQ
jgi:hypothetical protein